MSRDFLKVLGFAIFTLCTSYQSNSQQPEKQAFIEWAKEHTHELSIADAPAGSENLVPLSEITGDARIIALGESRHDIREQFLLKHRMMRDLVEELGFTTFMLESSLPYAYQLNAWLMAGEGNLEELLAGMPGWFIWDVEEMKAVFEWMRAYNEKQANTDKIQFHGIDITAPNEALDSIFSYLRSVDPAAHQHFQTRDFAQDQINDAYWPATLERYVNMSPDRKDSLANNYSQLFDHIRKHRSEYIAQSSLPAYRKILLFTSCAHEANRMFSAESRLGMGLIRDQAMAANISYIMDSLAPQQKAMIWAHNVHIAASTFRMTGEEGRIKGMGALLEEKYQDDYVALGASFKQGRLQNQNQEIPPAPAHFVDGTFAELEKKAFLLDLQNLPKDNQAAAWMQKEQILQAQGFEMSCIPLDAFDAFFFIDHISQVTFSTSSAQRFRDMGP